MKLDLIVLVARLYQELKKKVEEDLQRVQIGSKGLRFYIEC